MSSVDEATLSSFEVFKKKIYVLILGWAGSL